MGLYQLLQEKTKSNKDIIVRTGNLLIGIYKKKNVISIKYEISSGLDFKKEHLESLPRYENILEFLKEINNINPVSYFSVNNNSFLPEGSFSIMQRNLTEEIKNQKELKFNLTAYGKNMEEQIISKIIFKSRINELIDDKEIESLESELDYQKRLSESKTPIIIPSWGGLVFSLMTANPAPFIIGVSTGIIGSYIYRKNKEEKLKQYELSLLNTIYNPSENNFEKVIKALSLIGGRTNKRLRIIK